MPLFAPPRPRAPTMHPHMLNYPIFHYVGPRLMISELSMAIIADLYDLGVD